MAIKVQNNIVITDARALNNITDIDTTTSSSIRSKVLGYTVKTANYTAVSGDAIVANTSGGVWTLTLPATPSAGDLVKVVDGADWSANNLTIGRNGSTIEGDAADMTMDIGGAAVEFTYDGSTWQIFAQIGAGSGSGLAQVIPNADMDVNNSGGVTATDSIEHLRGRWNTSGVGITNANGTVGFWGYPNDILSASVSGINPSSWLLASTNPTPETYSQNYIAGSFASTSIGNNGGLLKVSKTNGSTGPDVVGEISPTTFRTYGHFWENAQTITADYTITNGFNAMSAGPITINSGVTVTVGAGETWTVV